ncbi:hypothetical protein ACTID9_12135 [Brevibacillus fluminis]|uniref:hypothetical protein n=1 Tax=Brevibacillus fluminis TaxID=511487 RepID=UPI003F89B5FB
MLQNKKFRLIIILGGIFVIVFAILFGISSVVLKSKHSEEIKSKITSVGGSIVDFESVNVNESPFESDSRGANTIYKITYSKDGKQMIAWYRAINNPLDIHHPSSKTLEEKWIFDK